MLTYVDQRMLNIESESFRALQRRVTSFGEPFLSGFDPKTFATTLKDCGLTLCEDLSGDEIAVRYGRASPLIAGQPSFSHIARARV